MPSRPQTPCRHPGCPQLIPSPGYCSAHQQHDSRRAYDARRRGNQQTTIRNSAQWQKVRGIHRQVEPLCRDPFGDHNGFPAPNEQSHHILPLATHPELAFDLSNLAALCTACHAKVERMERAGQPTPCNCTANRQNVPTGKICRT